MSPLAALAAGALALTVAAASCSTAGDDELQQIDSADLFGLDATTTSTTTTTTTIPVTATVPEATAPATTEAATSTTIATEPVQLYFLDGNRLEPVSIELARAPSPLRVVTALLGGPPAGDVGIGLRSLLPDDLVDTVIESGTGFVTVDLLSDPFNEIDPADQRAAIAQIVLTLVGRPGVGQVRFTLDDEPMRVPRREGLQSAPGELVSRQDYESLLRTIDPETSVPTTEPTDSTDATDPTDVTDTTDPAGSAVTGSTSTPS